MFYRQAMMRGRQLHPCVAVRGPTGSVAGGTWHVAETRGRLDIADRQYPGVTVEIVKRLLVDIDLTPVLVHLLSHRNNCESVLNTRGLVVDDWVLGVGLNGHASTSPVQGSLAFFYMTLVMYMGASLYSRSSALSLRQPRNVSAQPTVTTRSITSNAGSPYWV
jgi:hypothetical protein